MSSSADLLITNARVFTSDLTNPSAQAVAIRGNRIVFVGSDRDAAGWLGKSTHKIDAAGCTLMPGFIDSHIHLLKSSLGLEDLHADAVGTYEEFKNLLENYANENPDKAWLTGFGFHYNLGPNHTPFHRNHLDAVIADRPVFLISYDFHTAWANTLALKQAGIFHGADCGANNEIVLDEHGEATGEIREFGAMEKIKRLLPKPGPVEKRRLLVKGLKFVSSLGITSVHNMDGDAEQAALYASCESSAELMVRVYLPYSFTPDSSFDSLEKDAVGMMHAYQTGAVRSGCVKFFIDGVIESCTGLLLEDYADRPMSRGATNYAIEYFNSLIVEADRLGLQICVHSVGDGGVRCVLDAYKMARLVNGQRDHRHRIEHIELVHPDDVSRFAEMSVIASMQPYQAAPCLDINDAWLWRVGEERWPYSFAWETLRAAGAQLVFGSDWPCVSPNPLLGVHNALNRRSWKGGCPDQRMTLANALLSYTQLAAYAEFQEHCKGQVKPGYLADLVLLSKDIFNIPPEELKNVHPVITMLDGKIVYEA